MQTSRVNFNRRVSEPKYKAACDQCHASKVKCLGGGPPCKRCSDSSHLCQYSIARRIGKPPGTKNRKTSERLRQAKDRVNKELRSVANVSSIDPNIFDRDSSILATEPRSHRLERDDSIQIADTTSFPSLPSLLTYPDFHDPRQYILNSEQSILNEDQDIFLEDDCLSLPHSADLQLAGLDDFGRSESRKVRIDARDDFINVSLRYVYEM